MTAADAKPGTARLTNAEVLAGANPPGATKGADAYRALVGAVGSHDALCDAYGLDRDGVNGGTWWRDVVTQAYLHGDIDSEGHLT